MFDALPTALLFDTIGVLGFSLYVINYALLTVHRITSQSKAYFMMNLIAATLVLISLSHAFNLASALIQVFWIAISLLAVAMRMRDRTVTA